MRVSSIVGCVLAAVAVAWSGPAAAQKVVQPPELLMSVGIGPNNTLDSLRAFANTMQPGIGMMLSGQMLRAQLAGMVGAAALDGLDDKATTYVLAVDGGPALKGAAVVGKVTDENLLAKSVGTAHVVKKNGWAVVGPKLVAEKVAPFAFGALAPQPTIAGPPVATIYTANLVQRYKADIEKVRQQLVSGFGSMDAPQIAGVMQSYFDGLISALSDSERAIVTFDITKDAAGIDLALVPKAGSRLGKLVALQQPSDYALLGKLPASPAPVVVAGRLDSGPYRTGMLEAVSQLYGQATPKDMVAALGAVMKAATGDFAMTMQMAGGQGMSVTQLFGVADAKTADRAIGALLDGFKTPRTSTQMGMTTTVTTNPKATVHDGVTLRGYDVVYDFSKAPQATRDVMEKMIPKSGLSARGGTFDQLGVVALSDDGAAG
ncbi:MAG TPA: hypothetical protein VN253_01830, partial [Kofleriaceae bacterium]|nr:hypothetical protein [Kofleriaceae bacterium]